MPVIQQDIYKILFAANLKPVLAAGKSENSAHLNKKAVHLGYKGTFQFPFAVFFPEAEKIKGVFVFYGQFGLVTDFFRKYSVNPSHLFVIPASFWQESSIKGDCIYGFPLTNCGNDIRLH